MYILDENKGWITINTLLFETPCHLMWCNRNVLDLWSWDPVLSSLWNWKKCCNSINIFFQTVNMTYWEWLMKICLLDKLFIGVLLLTDSCVICYLSTEKGS